MGKLFYSSDPQAMDVDDRLLQYLQVVVATKLRRNESFTITWSDASNGIGRTTLWIQPAISMRFVYSSAESARLSGGYLRQLADHAAMSSGLVLDANTWEQHEEAHRTQLKVAA